MRIYEIMFILRPDMPEEDVDKFIAQMENIVTSTGGAIQKVDKWGRRRLAYEVRRQREGQYILFTFEGGPATVREFERILKVSEPVIKFLTVRIDEELKRLAKLKEQRDKRAARKPSAPQASQASQTSQASQQSSAAPAAAPASEAPGV